MIIWLIYVQKYGIDGLNLLFIFVDVQLYDIKTILKSITFSF